MTPPDDQQRGDTRFHHLITGKEPALMSTHRRGHQPEQQEGSGGEEKQRWGTDVARHQPLAKMAGREDYKSKLKSLFESVFHLLTSIGIAT